MNSLMSASEVNEVPINRQCVRRCVAFVLGVASYDVPDFVRSISGDNYNRNWESDLLGWAKDRGILAGFIYKAHDGWGESELAAMRILTAFNDPVIAMARRHGEDEGHAVVVKIGPACDEQSARIIFDPNHPSAVPGTLMFATNSEITHYLVIQRPRRISWWRRIWTPKRSND